MVDVRSLVALLAQLLDEGETYVAEPETKQLLAGRRLIAPSSKLRNIALAAGEHEVARSLSFPEPAFAVERARVAPDLKLHRRSRRHRLRFRKTLQLLAGYHVRRLAVSAPFVIVAQRDMHLARN